MREYRDYLQPDENRSSPLWLGLSSVTHFLVVLNSLVFVAFVGIVYVVLPYIVHVEASTPTIAREVLETLGLIPERAFGSGWLWQLVTYAFLHDPHYLLHLVLNMIMLYFFGREVETLYGPRRFLSLYLIGAVVAGCFYAALNYGSTAPLIGASGAIYAVMVTFAFHYPRQRILFFFLIPLEAWFVVSLCIAMSLTMQITGENGQVAHLAHLGGAFFGFVFYRYQDRLDTYLDRVERRIQKSETEHEEEIEARLDTLLEKISRDGISSLSKKERDFLKRASRHYQKKT